MCKVKTKVIPVKESDWNHLKIIQKIPEQHTGRTPNRGTTENSHIGHCVRASYSNNVQVAFAVRGSAVRWGSVLQAGRSWDRFSMVSLEFFLSSYGPVCDSASNRNEYLEYFLGDKGDRCVGLTTLPPSYVDCLEIWEPHPPGTLGACPSL